MVTSQADLGGKKNSNTWVCLDFLRNLGNCLMLFYCLKQQWMYIWFMLYWSKSKIVFNVSLSLE